MVHNSEEVGFDMRDAGCRKGGGVRSGGPDNPPPPLFFLV